MNNLSSTMNILLDSFHIRKKLVLRLKSQLFYKKCIAKFQQNLSQHNCSNSCSCQFFQSILQKSTTKFYTETALKINTSDSTQIIPENLQKFHSLLLEVYAALLKLHSRLRLK